MKYIAHQFFYDPSGIYLSGPNFLLHQKGPKKQQSILSLSSQGWNSLPGACSDLDIRIKLKFNCAQFRAKREAPQQCSSVILLCFVKR